MKGFRSFVEPTSIVFPENGLVLLQGVSGSGKSNIFLGISHAMGYCPFPATELQSWFSKEKFEVKTTLGTERGDITIVRGPKSYIEGAVSVDGASNLDSVIQNVTGLNQELLAALTYRPQKTPGLFLSKTNGEKQEFLSILLGLGKYERAIEVAAEHLKDLKTHYEDHSQQLPRLKERYDRAMALVAPSLKDGTLFQRQVESAQELYSLAEKARFDAQEKVDVCKAEWKKRQTVFSKMKAEIAENYPLPEEQETSRELEEARDFAKSVKARLDRLIAKDTADRQAIQKKIGAKNFVLQEFAIKRNDLKRYKKELDKLRGELLVLESNVCPRCEQTWVNDKASMAIADAQNKLRDLEQYVQDNGDLDSEISAIEAEIEELENSLVPNPKIDQMREVWQEALQKVRDEEHRLTDDYIQADLKRVQDLAAAQAVVVEQEKLASEVFMAEHDALLKAVRLAETERTNRYVAWQDAQSRLREVQQENKYVLEAQNRIHDEQTEATLRWEEAQKDSENLARQVSEEADLLEMLKSFMSAIFDEVLEQIAFAANEMLAQVPNVAHITVKFKSESVTQKGTVKRSIVPVVNIAGAERNLKAALSGGQGTAVELAVDLAVRKVISARSGAIPGFLIIDEAFEGLGVADKEACLDLLKQASTDTLILVIDHGSETKEFFSRTIEVELINGHSQIEG